MSRCLTLATLVRLRQEAARPQRCQRAVSLAEVPTGRGLIARLGTR